MADDEMNAETKLQELVELHEPLLRQCAERIRGEEAWSLNSPAVLVKENGEALLVPVTGVGSHLVVDSFVDDPLIQEWLELAIEEGPGRALETMLNDENMEKAEAFAGIYDQWREQVKDRGHATVSAGDLARFVAKARDFWPKQVPVLAVLKEGGKTGLMTFCVEVKGLLN